MSNYHPLPQPEELTTREKEDAMGAYLMMFAAIAAGLPLPIINLIASVIYYYINKSGNRFVKFHSLQALLSSLPLTIMNAIGLFWGIRILFDEDYTLNDFFYGYAGMVVIFNLIYYVFGILAAIKARKGRMFYYWFFGKIAYHHAFKVVENFDTLPTTNTPPKL